MEVNATSDLELFLTVDQMRLLSCILHSNLSAIWKRGGDNDDHIPPIPDSDASTRRRSEGDNPFRQLRDCTPFDVLLTGGKISMMLYSHERTTTQQTNSNISTPSSPSYKVLPFLFGLFSQPHLIVRCHSTTQKIEMSCYDVAVNGCGQDPSTENDRIVPVYSDFSTRWMETKPGKPDPNTGILRSFCTITLTNFLSSSGEMGYDFY